MNKNIGSKLALYHMPINVIGAMNGSKPTWTLVGHLGKPVLFEFPTYHYLKTGDVIGKCLSIAELQAEHENTNGREETVCQRVRPN